MKNTLVLILLLMTSCTLFGGDDDMEVPQPISQWAKSAEASSAAGGLLSDYIDDQSPFAATGQPDVDSCIDSERSWVTELEDDGEHWLKLTYEQGVYVSQVRIHETYWPGAVSKVEVLNDKNYVTLWQGEDTNSKCPGYFVVTYTEQIGNITKSMMPFRSNVVKITLDTDVEGWNEIDAVELIGYDSRWYVFNDSLHIE